MVERRCTARKEGCEVKRYLLFAGDQYYPSGGWHDLSGEFDSIEEAEEYVFERGYEWWHVVDREELRIVKAGCQG